MALVTAIKKKLAAALTKDVEMADTSPKPQQQVEQPVPVAPPKLVLKVSEEEKQSELVDVGLAELLSLKENDCAGNDPQHRDTVKLLLTIVNNLISKPLEPQVRRFNKTNKTIQTKILAFPSAVRFLELVREVFIKSQAGFDFSRNPNEAELLEYRRDRLDQVLQCLEIHVKNLGGQVQTAVKFDPYKASIASTDFQGGKLPPVATGQINTYDASAVQQEIDRIQEERMVKDQNLLFRKRCKQREQLRGTSKSSRFNRQAHQTLSST